MEKENKPRERLLDCEKVILNDGMLNMNCVMISREDIQSCQIGTLVLSNMT